MRLLHTADLHLGKTLQGVDLSEEQRAVCQSIVTIARQEAVNAVLLAGDIYDRPIPSLTAVALLDDFLSALSEAGIRVFLISGNHDSGARLSFASRIFRQTNLCVEALPQASITALYLSPRGLSQSPWPEGTEQLHIFLLPYVRRSDLRHFFPELAEASYSTLFAAWLEPLRPILAADRARGIPTLALAHQWLVADGREGEESGAELPRVGLAEPLPASLFKDFDYGALGHLHRPQYVGEKLVYAGSPLKFSATEKADCKSVTLLECSGGRFSYHRIPLPVPRDLLVLRGSLDTLLADEDPQHRQAFVYLEMTEAALPEDAVRRLQAHFPHLLQLRFPQAEDVGEAPVLRRQDLQESTMTDLFARFFAEQSGHPLTASQRALLESSYARAEAAE